MMRARIFMRSFCPFDGGKEMEILEKLGLGLTEIIFYAINLIILIVVLYLLLYKPVKKIIAGHREKLNEVFLENKKLNEEANSVKHKYEDMVEQTKQEAIKLNAELAEKAQAKSEEVILQAKAQANNILISAKKEAQAEQTRLKSEVKDTASKLAIEIAEKVLEREISNVDNEKIINECLKSWDK